MVEALANHVIDVGLTDTPFARAAQWDYGTDKLALKELSRPEDFPKELEPERRFERYAIAVRDGENELIDAIDKAIEQMREKKLAELLETAAEEFYATKGGATRNLPMFDRKQDPSNCEPN
jgi:ABC-type amino acid transport substrate-binding protein